MTSSAGATASPAFRSLASSVARARWRALLTEATLVSSSSAASLACQRSTSQRISAARCFGGRCWRAATNASLIVSCATATSAGSPSSCTTSASGAGSIQVTSGSVERFDSIGSRRRAEVHRPGASLAARDHVQADVRRDPVEPRAERRPALESAQALPGTEERLLDGVLGLEHRAEHPVAVAGELAAVRPPARSRARCGRGSFLPPPSAPMLRTSRPPPRGGIPYFRAPAPQAGIGTFGARSRLATSR